MANKSSKDPNSLTPAKRSLHISNSESNSNSNQPNTALFQLRHTNTKTNVTTAQPNEEPPRKKAYNRDMSQKNIHTKHTQKKLKKTR